MKLRHRLTSPRARGIAVFAVSAALLFSGFYLNLGGVAHDRWFGMHQKDMESFILGRLVKSRQDGILSARGLTGYGTRSEKETGFSMSVLRLQYQAYLADGELAGFVPYTSQIGGQGLLLSVLDRLAPLPPQTRLRLWYALTSLLGALVLATIVLWFQLELGLPVALTVLVTAAGSQWLVVFGRNLWWSTWAFYLPLAVAMHALRASGAASRPWPLAALIFAAVFLKCVLNGYEYVTTTLMMLLVPFVYYGVADGQRLLAMGRRGLVAAASASGAVLLSLVILVYQIAPQAGGPSDAALHLVGALQKRSHADPNAFPEVFRPSLSADTLPVVATYLKGAYFDLQRTAWSDGATGSVGERFPIRLTYWMLALLFLAASGVVLWGGQRGAAPTRRSRAPVAAAWFAALAPLSWFVIFKAHSHVHTHMNFLVWQMPFTLFGFGLCALAARRLGAAAWDLRSRLPGRHEARGDEQP